MTKIAYLCKRKSETVGITPPFLYALRGVAQSGSAPGLGPGGRRFESCRPDNPRNASGFSTTCVLSFLKFRYIVFEQFVGQKQLFSGHEISFKSYYSLR